MLYVACVLFACLFANSEAGYNRKIYQFLPTDIPYEQYVDDVYRPRLPGRYSGFLDYLFQYGGYKSRQSDPGRHKTIGARAFNGQNLCHESTEAKTKLGDDFKVIGYLCVCKPGYYLPKAFRSQGAFYNTDLEKAYDHGEDMSQFQCFRCRPAGCHECVNERFCISASSGMHWPQMG